MATIDRTEVAVAMEGELRYVQASGTPTSWATASAPVSGLIGFCEAFSYTSALTTTVQSERGIPKHWKHTDSQPIDFSFDFKWTGWNLTGLGSGGGTTVPLLHFEYRVSAKEVGSDSATYYQFMGVPVNSIAFTENLEGDTITMATMALAMVGPTASGYIK